MAGTPMPAGRRQLLARLADFPARLAPVARAVAAADAAGGGPPTGEWSARENVAHLVAVERTIWQARLDHLAASPPDAEPTWPWTEPRPVEDEAAGSLDGALRLFEAERAATLARLASLDDDGWGRTGLHVVYGRLDVVGLLGIVGDHDDEHIATMTAGRTLAPQPNPTQKGRHP